MALDTRNKRSSAIGVSLPWRNMLPDPDGTTTQADRQAVAYLYAGILAATTAPASAQLCYLGRYWLGDAVPLVVQSRNNANTPTDAASAPYARIYSSTTFVKVVRLPKTDHSDITGLFQFLLHLDGTFSTGFYDVIVDYLVVATQKVQHLRFEIVAGGDSDGKAIKMYYLRQPDRAFLLAQLDAGRIKKLQNPEIT